MVNKVIKRIYEEKTAAEKQLMTKSNTDSYWFGRLTLANELLKFIKSNIKD